MASTALHSSLVGSVATPSLQSLRTLNASESSVQTTRSAPRDLVVRAAGGTRIVKNLKVVQIGGDKTGTVRSKVAEEAPAVKLLSRVQELRLLSKAEQAGLLSLAEKLGLSLSTIENLGLLSKAEDLGLLSAATNPSTPSTLLLLALGLLISGPLAVFVIPEDNVIEVLLQVIVAATTVGGGAAAFGGSQLLASLQKTD